MTTASRMTVENMGSDAAALGYRHGYELSGSVAGATTEEEWARETMRLAGCAESTLYDAAYSDHDAAGDGTNREEYARAHVCGQIARAKELTRG